MYKIEIGIAGREMKNGEGGGYVLDGVKNAKKKKIEKGREMKNRWRKENCKYIEKKCRK